MTSTDTRTPATAGPAPVAALETRADRNALAADAGWGRLSFLSMLAGALVAFGAFHTLAVLAAGLVDAFDYEVDLAARWDGFDLATAVVVGSLLFVAFLFGGYAAGRMARRSGTLNGAGAFGVGLVLAVGGGLLATQLATEGAQGGDLRALGILTGVEDWTSAGTLAGLAFLVAALVGAVAGGRLGERWHARLLARAMNPRIGAEAEAHRLALAGAAEAERRRVTAFTRARAASPTRTARVDREAARVDREAAKSTDGDDHDGRGGRRGPRPFSRRRDREDRPAGATA